jgi:xanthine/uracil permease
MRLRPSVTYFVLLLSSLAVPGLHYFVADRAVEHTRLGAGLLPATTLFWRELGEMSCLLPVLAIVFFVLSFRREWFSRVSTLLGLAVGQLLFITFYAVYCALLLSHVLLGG